MSHRIAISARTSAIAANIINVSSSRHTRPITSKCRTISASKAAAGAASHLPSSGHHTLPTSSPRTDHSIYHNRSYPNSRLIRFYHHRNHHGCIGYAATSRRTISSTPPVHAEKEDAPSPSSPPPDSSTKDDKKETDAKEEDEEDKCPDWQNPLHHNNPDYTSTFEEDFSPGEEMPLSPLPPFELEGEEDKVLAPPHIHELADEIVHLNMLELKELLDRIGDHFGFTDGDMDDGDGDSGDGGGEKEAEVVVEEKTIFDLKLMGFDAKTKIKVIKEVRGVTTLGLKEAKDLVEGAPAVIKKGIKMEEAEELKAKFEALGAVIEIA